MKPGEKSYWSQKPSVRECPVNLERRLVEILDFGVVSEIFIGEIVESYAEKHYLSNQIPDIENYRVCLFLKRGSFSPACRLFI